RTVKIPRNKIVADAFHLVWTGLSSTENRALRLYRHGVHLRDPLFQETGNSSKSSGRAAADRDGIDAPLHLFKDFARRSFVVVVGIGGIVELRSQEGRRVGCQQVLGALNGALHTLGLRSAGNLGAEGAHDDDLFLRKLFRHKQPHLIASAHTDQSQADAGVSGSGLDHGTAAPKLAFALGARDQANSSAVFHAAARVQVFEFGKNVSRARRSQLLHVQHRRFADKFGNLVTNAQAGI